MSAAAEKTLVLVLSGDGKDYKKHITVNYGGQRQRVVKTTKNLGITLDSKLSFKEHIQEKSRARFATLRSLDMFIQGQNGCSQSIYLRLYRALL